jgi:hypothetical protein
MKWGSILDLSHIYHNQLFDKNTISAALRAICSQRIITIGPKVCYLSDLDIVRPRGLPREKKDYESQGDLSVREA